MNEKMINLFFKATGLFFKAFKIIIKIIIFTGLWLFFLFGIIDLLLQKYFNFTYPIWLYYILLVFSLIFAVYTIVNKIIQFIKHDGSFSLIGLFKDNPKMNFKFKSIKELESREPKGFIFGKKNFNFYCKDEKSDGHILVIGGAGSGKSSCLAIPTLLSWKNRVFAIDIKGELSEKSKKTRKTMQIFNPEDENSLGYNPFYFLNSDFENRTQNAREIALIISPVPAETKDPFWIEAGQNILTGCIIYFNKKGLNFIDTIKEIQGTPIKRLINEMYESNDQEIKLFIGQFIDMDEKTISGIMTELSNKIMIFATDNQIKKALSKENYITPNLLENGNDIFINIPEHKLEQWKSLLTLIVAQFLKYFERRKETKELEPILFMLDEFARLGKVEPITNGLATLRSKKITIALLIQSLSQLDLIYNKETRQVIADNCSYKAILKATDADTQEYLSKLVGTFDRLKKTKGSSQKQLNILSTSSSSETTEEKRIIKPEQFAYLEDIVLLTPYNFTRINKTPYYLERIFKNKI